MALASRKRSRTATHRPAARRRRFRHDDYVAVDLFSGFGGLTEGVKRAGFTTIMAANHNPYKVQVHEANHPEAEHWIADLVDPDAADYHSARDLPAADLLVAGVSCTNHSIANTVKAYAQGLTLFGMDDPDFEERVTRSERDRATASCVLHYAAQHHPRLILIECTTELTSWGPALPNRPKVGDGSTYRWWLKQFGLLNYRHKVLYLNSQFFGVPQSRDRLYLVFWDQSLPAPDLEHRPVSRCLRCERDVEAVWSWKTGVPPSGSVRYGKQYEYRCPSCRTPVVPAMPPSLAALDLADLGTRIGDRKKPLAGTTMARAERCRQRFADFPAVLLPTETVHGAQQHPWQPAAVQAGGPGASILATGAIIAAAGNTFERPGSNCRSRGFDQPLWAQPATNTTGLITPSVAVATGSVIAAHRHNGDGQHITRPMDTVTSTHEKAVLLAVDNYQGGPRGVGSPLPTQVGSETLAVVSSGVIPYRQNTLPAVHGEAMPTVTADQIPGLLTATGTINRGLEAQLRAEWRAVLAGLPLEDCYFRMMAAHEVGRGCGFDVNFRDYRGSFTVWGSARDQVDGFGNAVSPQVGTWIGTRLRAVLHTPAPTSG
ncbi:DNA cytosine methyltransferase (plasmid) [Streptomyces sp. Qhu-G9]|uniref:DNA cytosine methyltransferase n=1 Tax=Streptomyces sp. Qhu-G9 TaxID=3452799 RepID=UPI0022AC7C9B|nr:DNA cytosine methyltransferase [Streptomyces aurantiacus]WAU78319.1 DNA cytosine methyltransferase [Streptomyces aurantiacus]